MGFKFVPTSPLSSPLFVFFAFSGKTEYKQINKLILIVLSLVWDKTADVIIFFLFF